MFVAPPKNWCHLAECVAIVAAAPRIVFSCRLPLYQPCTECNHVAGIISDKFHKTNRDDLVSNMLSLCDRFSSYSDACANLILAYFNDIYNAMKNTLSADSLCHMSGVCSAKFHHHEGDNLEIRPRGKVGVVPVADDDITCDLCKQLVHHLRDVLIANTTEAEFKMVLEGLCKQAGKFANECASIADQYYDLIYKDLVNNLDAEGACFLIGVCKKGVAIDSDVKQPLPYLPLLVLLAVAGCLVFTDTDVYLPAAWIWLRLGFAWEFSAALLSRPHHSQCVANCGRKSRQLYSSEMAMNRLKTKHLKALVTTISKGEGVSAIVKPNENFDI